MIQGFKGLFFGLSLCALVSTACFVLLPWIFYEMILLKKDFLMGGTLSLGALLFGGFARYFLRINLTRFGRKEEVRLREEFFEKYFFSQVYVEKDTYNPLLFDLDHIREWLTKGIYYLLYFLSSIFLILGSLILLDLRLALIAALPILLIPALLLWLTRYLESLLVSLQHARELFAKALSSVISQANAIARRKEDLFACKYLKAKEEALLESKKRKDRFEGGIFPLMTLITRSVTIFLLACQSIYSYITYPEAFFTFMWIQALLFLPIIQLGVSLLMYGRAQASYKRLSSLQKNPTPEANSVICLQGQPLEKGKIHLIYGHKSLSDLTFGGKNLFESDLEYTYLPEKIHFFTASLKENLFSTELTSFVKDELKRLKLSLDMHLYNQGDPLSLGQKKAIAWMRLFLRKSSLKILENPFAHLDKLSLLVWREALIKDVETGGTAFLFLEDQELFPPHPKVRAHHL